MVVKMKDRLFLVMLTFLMLGLFACSNSEKQQGTAVPVSASVRSTISNSKATDVNMDVDSLDKIAELERSGRFSPGLGFAESTIREKAGDYAGAVVAAYKELSWSYAFSDARSSNPVTINQIKEGLNSVLALSEGNTDLNKADVSKRDTEAAATAVLCFLDGKWEEAGDLLGALFSEDEEIDSFSQWMILVCSFEQKDASRTVRSKYAAIRSRYEYFPEYWHRLARFLDDEGGKMDAAERCILLAPYGAYALECRSMLAGIFGINTSRSSAILIRSEIERAITSSVASRDAELLRPLFPLLELPDNPYTMYAIGALQALSAEPSYKNFFVKEAGRSSGRLNERLVYISKG